MATAAPSFFREKMDHLTNAAAAGAITTPFWFPWLQTASELAAAAAPILGIVWLAVQIWAKITITNHEKKSNEQSPD